MLWQEELGEEISGLVHSFATYKAALMFVETFFISMSVEWFGIDQLRMDKFMMVSSLSQFSQRLVPGTHETEQTAASLGTIGLVEQSFSKRSNGLVCKGLTF